jgi:phage-related minor tail protein
MIHERTEEPSDNGGGGGATKNEYQREVAAIRDEVAALKLEAAALVATAAAGETYGAAIEAARREAELLHAAQKQGREITPALRAEIAALAHQYGEAAQAAQNAEDGLDRLADAKAEIKNVAGDAFSDLITGARDFNEVLGDLLGRLAEMAANRAFENMWSGMSGGAQTTTGGTNWIATLASAFLGFDRGGYTGDGGKHEPAGIVHKGEFVLSADATRRIGVRNLQALHEAARRGFSSGGYVGSRAPLEPLSAGRTESLRASRGGITINAPVTVNASGGSPEQNADLAKQVSREVEANMRGAVVEELRRQMRPGNLLGKR